MKFLSKNEKNEILTYIPLIKIDYSHWHIINLKFDVETEDEAKEIVAKFIDLHSEQEGFCFLEDNTKAIAIIKLGDVESYSDLKSNIESNLKDKRCRVLARKMSANGMKQIQINLSSGASSSDHSLYEEREKRINNVILIADDDLFIRKTLKSLLGEKAIIHEAETGDKVVSAYKEYNPDVVVLDIHMPNKNGLEIISELIELDSDAFIVTSSSDSVKDNVLESVKRGAIGFLAKPVRKEKINQYLEQCITYKS